MLTLHSLHRQEQSEQTKMKFEFKKEDPEWQRQFRSGIAKHAPQKSNLTLEEAAAYSGIGINKLREISNDESCRFVLWVGNKRLIKRRLLDEYIDHTYSI